MLRFIILLFLIIYTGFKSDGFNGVLTCFETLGCIMCEWLKLLNIASIYITGDSILTHFFFYYIVYTIVGLIFELFNIKKGYFGRLFGNATYWIIGIPVSFILNYFSSMLFG